MKFAQKYSFDIIQVVDNVLLILRKAYTKDGVAINSDFLDGLTTLEAKAKMIDFLEDKDHGKRKINFSLKTVNIKAKILGNTYTNCIRSKWNPPSNTK